MMSTVAATSSDSCEAFDVCEKRLPNRVLRCFGALCFNLTQFIIISTCCHVSLQIDFVFRSWHFFESSLSNRFVSARLCIVHEVLALFLKLLGVFYLLRATPIVSSFSIKYSYQNKPQHVISFDSRYSQA